MRPKVSVLIPSYNHRHYVSEAILSVLAQTETDFELLVLDDGSTDGSDEIIEALASRDSRIQFRRQENRGTIETINRLYAMSQGEFICHLGSDDTWRPSFLASSLRDLEEHPTHVATFCNFSEIDKHGAIVCEKGVKIDGDLADGALMAEIAICNIIAALTACIRRSAIEKTLPFARQRVGVEDWDLWLRLSLVGPMRLRDENHGSYRMHDTNQSLGNRKKTCESQLQILKDHTRKIIALYKLHDQISLNLLVRKLILCEAVEDTHQSALLLEEKRHSYGLSFHEYALLAGHYISMGEDKKARKIEYVLQQVQRETRHKMAGAMGAEEATLRGSV